MEELEQILRLHARRYPLMEPTDGVKLIFQNEFGGGHLIRNEAQALTFLRREYEAVKSDPSVPETEPIGNGIVRVNLAALPPEKLEALGAEFLRSAGARVGSRERFEEKLDVLRRLAREGVFAFGPEELEAYLLEYRQAGYPAVSHSPAYRQAYSPAYRIVIE